jgi:5'-nucleotidase
MVEPRDLKGARILLTNDDGIDAPGLAVLEQVARQLTDDVWVCAPSSEQSGASHSLTMHRPLRLKELGSQRYTVDGTPTDCVLVALNHLFKDERKPDLVLSGINHGSNIGDDVVYSGTVSAAMEATMLGVRAIGLSQRLVSGHADWDTPRRWGAEVIRRICAMPWPRNVMMSINFPPVAPDAITGIHAAPLGIRKIGDRVTERTDPRGRPYFWVGTMIEVEDPPVGSDVAVIRDGGIAVTALQVDLTHYPLMDDLGRALAEIPLP